MREGLCMFAYVCLCNIFQRMQGIFDSGNSMFEFNFWFSMNNLPAVRPELRRRWSLTQSMAMERKLSVVHPRGRKKERNTRGSAKGAQFWKFNKLNFSTALISEYKETLRWIYYCGIHNAAKIEACGPNLALRCKSVIFPRMSVELLTIYWIHYYHFFFVVVA